MQRTGGDFGVGDRYPAGKSGGMGASDTVEFTAAVGHDEAEIAALLAAADLPHSDIGAHWANFIVARAEARIVGVVGAEVHGADGLLRSLAVAAAWRGRGLGRQLVQRLRVAQPAVRRWWVLTTTAESFFAELRFGRVERRLAPAAIAATEEFRTLCPSTAVCLVRREAGP
ncbi:GNAT family N-acetyltransferase [Horticoccus luteus]|uniref:GNAT family N-acetyltransferase n=1 Tax=Horticoccus luteus TaxID=2862869 RepID=A0A8F9TX09_9BACT|nr:arsenic resistance N-acetyltransferase ArsN2 [Horticoccus luteus]QYM79308.1 GNAT family N-acetyltransferase [Horticoccus luteus]